MAIDSIKLCHTKKSNARINLQTNYEGIRKRLGIADKPAVDPQLREYVIAAAIFLAHAEIENYISDIFSSFAVAVNSWCTRGSQLPSELQSYLFLSRSNAKVTYANFFSDNSEKKLLQAFIDALRGDAGKLVDQTASFTKFSGPEILNKSKYPSKDNLERLFNRVGIKNVFSALNAQLSRNDSAALLKSIGDIRTSLAHSGIIPGMSCKDVRQKLDQAELLVGGIDRIMFKFVCKHLGASAWQTQIAL